MDLVEIKEKLEEALETENWDIVLEIIGDIDLEENYTSPYDDSENEDDGETWGWMVSTDVIQQQSATEFE